MVFIIIKMRTIILALLATISLSTVSKTWKGVDSITSGLVSISTSSTTQGSATVTFPTPLTSSNYQYILAPNSFLLYRTDVTYIFQVQITSSSIISFIIRFIISSIYTNSHLRASYLFFDRDAIPTGLQVKHILISSMIYGSTSRTYTSSAYPYGRPASVISFVNYIYSVHASYGSSLHTCLYFTANPSINPSFYLVVTVRLYYNTNIHELGVYCLIFETSYLYSQYSISLDSGSVVWTSPTSTASISLPNLQTSSYIVGYKSIGAYIENTSTYQYSKNEFYNQMLITQIGYFYSVQVDYINFRTFGCPSTSPYFITTTTDQCTNDCGDFYYGDTSTMTCEQCHYSCKTCSGSAYSQCLSCQPSHERTLSSGKCLCNSDYSDNGVQLCVLICITGCSVCVQRGVCQTCSTATVSLTLFSVVEQVPYFKTLDQICKICHDHMLNCLQCTSEAVCTKCFSHNAKWRVKLSEDGCECNSANSYFQSNSDCALCSSLIIGCTTCSSNTTCSICNYSANFTRDGSICVCKPGFFLSSGNCAPCHFSCTTCVNTAVHCTGCSEPNFRVANPDANHQCPCKPKYYQNSVAACPECLKVCATCVSATTCSTCVSGMNLVHNISDQQCVCPNTFYALVNRERCDLCSSIITHCSTCSDYQTCTTCNHSNYTTSVDRRSCACSTQFFFNTSNIYCVKCQDLIVGCLHCLQNDTCQICDVPGYFRLEGPLCVCKDGFYLSGRVCLPCEVSCMTCVNTATFCLTCNNTALRTFAENRCDCVIPFSDCRNSSLTQCEDHTCSLLTPVQITIKSMIKDPQLNKLTFEITFGDYTFPEYNTFDFPSLFNLELPDNTTLSYSYSNGTLTVEVQYWQDLQGQFSKMELFINQTDFWQFKLAPESIMEYQIAPTNNLAANVYSEQVYNTQKKLSLVFVALSGASFIVYLVGLVSSKIASTEMVAVMQISYLGLFIVNHADPLFYSLKNLEYTYGLNNLVDSAQQKSPSRIFYSGQTASVISNLNLMLCFVIIPPILSLIFYQIHLKSTQWRIRMERAWKLVLGQWSLTVFLFLLYNYSSSLAGFCLFTSKFDAAFYLSILELVVLTTIFGLLLYLFKIKDKVWMGEYKQNFNWNFFSGNYYFIPIAQRFMIGVTLTVGNMTYVSAGVAIVFLLSSIVVIGVKKPFVQNCQNIRSIITNIYSIIILGVYIVYSIKGPKKSQTSIFMYFPYAIIAVLGLNLITGIGSIIRTTLKKSAFDKMDERCEKQDIEEEELHQQINSKIQEMIKEAKSNNIKNRLINKPSRRVTSVVSPSANSMNTNYKRIRDQMMTQQNQQ